MVVSKAPTGMSKQKNKQFFFMYDVASMVGSACIMEAVIQVLPNI